MKSSFSKSSVIDSDTIPNLHIKEAFRANMLHNNVTYTIPNDLLYHIINSILLIRIQQGFNFAAAKFGSYYNCVQQIPLQNDRIIGSQYALVQYVLMLDESDRWNTRLHVALFCENKSGLMQPKSISISGRDNEKMPELADWKGKKPKDCPN